MARFNCTYPPGPSWATNSDLLLAYGATIPVDVGFDPDFDENQPQLPPKLGARGVSALIDTGATISYIDTGLAKRLGLIAIDKDIVSAVVGGPQEIVVYLGQIHIPSLNFTMHGKFGGTDLAAGGMKFEALLGRDILMFFTMTYDGTAGEVVIQD